MSCLLFHSVEFSSSEESEVIYSVRASKLCSISSMTLVFGSDSHPLGLFLCLSSLWKIVSVEASSLFHLVSFHRLLSLYVYS